MNTKHSKEDIKTYAHITDEKDMFLIEMVEDEIVYACIICDQGFEISEEVKKAHNRSSSGFYKPHPYKSNK